MKKKKYFILAVSIMLILTLGACSSETEEEQFPTSTIEIVVPYSAGGGLDTITRMAAESLDLDVPTTITNMVGGSSLIATKDVANGDKSGHRLLAHHVESIVTYYKTGIFDEDYNETYNWICAYVFDPMCVAVGKDSPINSWEDLVEDALSRPGEQTMGGAGNMSTNHLASAMMMQVGDFRSIYVPYDGAADARIAAMGGNLDIFVGQLSEMVPFAQSGDLKLIITMGEERSEWVPDVPTLAEIAGTLEDTTFGLSRGVLAPEGVSEDKVKILEDAYYEAFQSETFQKNASDKLYYIPSFKNAEECKEIVERVGAQIDRTVAFIESEL